MARDERLKGVRAGTCLACFGLHHMSLHSTPHVVRMSRELRQRYLVIQISAARETASVRLTTDTPATCDAECREVNKLMSWLFRPARPCPCAP